MADGGVLPTLQGQETQEDIGKLADALSAAQEVLKRLGSSQPAAAAAPIDFASELSNIPFRTMISGPLQAAVDAQIASSLATIDFINKVGFTASENGGKREIAMVDFSHTRKEKDAEGKEVTRDVDIKVPLLATMPIPSLRIEHVIIDFNAKLNSIESSEISDELKIEGELKVGWGPVNFRVTASYQRKTSTNVEVKREYTIGVNVKAVQDEMPAGLERVLGMLAS